MFHEIGLINYPVTDMATEVERGDRLGERSPDMAAAERRVRLADDGTDMEHSALEVINTTGLSDIEGQLALRSIVGQVLAANG